MKSKTTEGKGIKLKQYNKIIQVCPNCGKVDVDDKHKCSISFEDRLLIDEYNWK